MAPGCWTRLGAGRMEPSLGSGHLGRFHHVRASPFWNGARPLQQPSSHPGQDLPIRVPVSEPGLVQVLRTRSEVRAAGEAVSSGNFKDFVIGKKKDLVNSVYINAC